MKSLLDNFQDGKFQTAVALIIAEIAVSLVPGSVQKSKVLQNIVIIALVVLGFDALQKGLSLKFNVGNDSESIE